MLGGKQPHLIAEGWNLTPTEISLVDSKPVDFGLHVVEVKKEDLFIVHYQEPTLEKSFEKVPLREAIEDPERFGKLHDAWIEQRITNG